MKNDFVVLLTGAEDSMSLARDYLTRTRKEVPAVFPFKLFYSPPYSKFYGLQNFQLQTRYQPFRTSPRKEAVVILDLSEWLGHEQEDYLTYFLKYLQNTESFYEPEFVVTLGSAAKEDVRKMYILVSRYLGTGAEMEDRTLVDWEALSAWLKAAYPLEREAAECLAEVLLRKPIPSLDWVRTITVELMQRVNRKGTVTVQQLAKVVSGSKLELFCGASKEDFRGREMEDEQ